MGPPALYIVGGIVIAAGAAIAFKEFVYDPFIHPRVQEFLERRNARRPVRAHAVYSDNDPFEEEQQRPVNYMPYQRRDVEMTDVRVRSGVRAGGGGGVGGLRQRGSAATRSQPDEETRTEDPFADPRHEESDVPVTSSRSRSHGRFGLQTPTESPMLSQPAGHVLENERQRGRGPFSPLASSTPAPAPAVPAHELLFDAEEANSTLPRLQIAPATVTSATVDSDAEAEALAQLIVDESHTSSPTRSPFSPSTTKTMNRRSVFTDHTVASTTRQTRTSMTPSLLRTPPGTHARPTAPSPGSANERPAAPVPMSMSASMQETEEDDDLVLSFLSALSERSGGSERGSVGEDERYEQEGIRMPQPRVRVPSPPSVSDGEHPFDVRSLDSESAAGSRAISPFVFDVEAETAHAAQLVGPSFSVDPASGSASSGAILDTFSPIQLPHAPGIYGAGSQPRSSPPGYESRFVSPMPARSPLTQTSPPRGMSSPRSPRSPRSDAGSAWTSASVEHPEREDARSPEGDFDFESVSSAMGSPVNVVRGLGVVGTTDVEADDESPAMGGAPRRRVQVRPRGA